MALAAVCLAAGVGLAAGAGLAAGGVSACAAGRWMRSEVRGLAARRAATCSGHGDEPQAANATTLSAAASVAMIWRAARPPAGTTLTTPGLRNVGLTDAGQASAVADGESSAEPATTAVAGPAALSG